MLLSITPSQKVSSGIQARSAKARGCAGAGGADKVSGEKGHAGRTGGRIQEARR